MNATTNIKTMGISEFQIAINAGELSHAAVLAVLDERIAKRAKEKRPQIARVVEYRNQLAALRGDAPVPVPVYAASAKAPSSIPDIDSTTVADQVAALLLSRVKDKAALGHLVTALAKGLA